MIELELALTGAAAIGSGALHFLQARRIHTLRRDERTGLPLRDLWMAKATRAARRPQGLVVLMVDGDGLKAANDRYGHKAGDQLIRALGHRLESWTGQRGLVGRWGGDEFAIFLRLGPEDDDLTRFLAALCESLYAPVRYRGTALEMGASIGAVQMDELLVPTLDDAFEVADQALRDAKEAGGFTWRLAEPGTESSPAGAAPQPEVGQLGQGG